MYQGAGVGSRGRGVGLDAVSNNVDLHGCSPRNHTDRFLDFDYP